MNIVGVTEDQFQHLVELQEKRELEEIRASVRIQSIEDTDMRFAKLELDCSLALAKAEEAYIYLVEDELDDYETAKEKADKLDRIEREHARTIAQWENQRQRIGWEARDAQPRNTP
jgi:hypothetical protein